MRILVITQYFFPHSGGSQEYILELYKEVIKQDPSLSVDVICYNTDNAPKEENMDGLNVYRIPCWQILPGQFAVPNFVELFNVLRKFKKLHKKYDIVNSHTRFFDNSWWAPLTAKYFSAKSVLTDHCASHPVHQNNLINTGVQLLDTLLVSLIPQMYDRVTSVSKTTSDFLQKGGYKKAIPVFYSGVHQAFLAKKESALPVKISPDDVVVTFVGRMIASKNPDLALKVAQTMTKTNPHVSFVFAGEGPELDELKKAATEKIIFVGKLDRSTTASLLRKTDILIHPSKHHEGLPITLLEAGASKTAVVASDAGATHEVIINNQTGIIVDSTVTAISQSLKVLINDPSLRKKLSTNLQKKVLTEFNWKQTAVQYLSFLKKLSS